MRHRGRVSSWLKQRDPPADLSRGGFRASLPADPPDQAEQLLPHAVALHLPALHHTGGKRAMLLLVTRLQLLTP